MKLGYSTWGMPTVPIDTAVQHIAGLGYDGLELTIIPRFTTELSTLDAVIDDAIAFGGGGERDDDMTVVVVKVE